MESLEPIPYCSIDPNTQEVEREAEPFAGFNRVLQFFNVCPSWPSRETMTMDCSCYLLMFFYGDIWGTKRQTRGSLFGVAFLACSQVLSSTLEGPAERHLLSPSENYAPGRSRIDDAKMESFSLKPFLATPHDAVWVADHPNKLFQ